MGTNQAAAATGRNGKAGPDNRTMLNGMLWIVRSGAQWRELPETYGPGSLYTPDSPNGGMTALWKRYSIHCLRTRIWRT